MRRTLPLALALALLAPAAGAATYELYPTNKRGADGVYRNVLEVVRNHRVIAEYRADRNEIPAGVAFDPSRAIALVVQRLRLDPARDRVIYCTRGQAPAVCLEPDIYSDLPPAFFWP